MSQTTKQQSAHPAPDKIADEQTSFLKTLKKVIKEAFVPSVFMACLAYLGHAVFSPFNAISYVLLANLGHLAAPVELPPSQQESAPFVVVGIAGSRYTSEYFGQSPLPRCQLLKDLSKLYAQNPKTVALDFDLSPTIYFQKTGTNSQEGKCEAEITTLLGNNAERTILITPFPVEEASFAPAKQQWMQDLCAKGMTFAEPYLNRGWGGVVYDQTISPYSMANAVASRVASPAAGNEVEHPEASLCDKLKTGKEGAATTINGYLTGQWESPQWLEHEAHPKLLNFAALTGNTRFLGWESGNDHGPGDLTGKHVFFGAKYGVDDRLPTPIGERYGVDLHAAAAHSLLKPIDGLPDIVGLAVDLCIGLFFACFVSFFWTAHFDAVAGIRHKRLSPLANRALAPVWLTAFVIVYFLLICLAAGISFWLLTHLGLWLAPIPIAIGMFVDGFMTGGVEHASHHLSHHEGKDASSEESFGSASRFVIGLMRWSRFAIYWLVVGYGLFAALFH